MVKSWDDSIFGWSAQAAFWQALSFAPLLLGVLGTIGYVARWFGPDTVDVITARILSFAGRIATPAVVEDLITPTVDTVLSRGPVGLISIGFLLSLWAGSSAMSCFIDATVHAHHQHTIRHPVWQRIFALMVYFGFLVVGVLILPLVAVGPTYLQRIVKEAWVSRIIDLGYFPLVGLMLVLVLVALYRFALPHPLPWLRLVPGAMLAGITFWITTWGLRVYLVGMAEAGVTYGALATPLAFLLFAFFLGFAIVLGAEFNATIQEFWPVEVGSTGVRGWVTTQAGEITDSFRSRLSD